MSEGLTTGWEPEAPVGDTLLRRFLFCSAERLGAMTDSLGGTRQATPAAAFFDPASAFVFDTAVILLQPPADLTGVVEAAGAFYPPERTWVLISAWPLPALPGLELVGHPPFMMRPPGGSPRPDPPGLAIVEVDSIQALSDFERVLVEGYPMPAGGAVADPRLLGGPVRAWVGYDAGRRPVAVAGSHTGHGVVEVDWVATLPDARHRGYGEAVTWRATLADPELPAVLLASDPGRPVYERMGYIALQRFTVWWRPGRT